MFLTSDFDFELPQELIAQQPFFPKEKTKMLTFKNGEIIDSQVLQLANFLQEGDLLVFNDAKVINAKLQGKILRNSAVLDFNLDQENQGVWQALCRPAKKVIAGDVLEIAPNFSAKVLEKTDDGFIKIKFNLSGSEFMGALEKYGTTPLPPYIKRDEKNLDDLKNYQTIYAKNGVAAAAPTAGLHFSEKIFQTLKDKKINTTFITLNVGAGTFLPVRADNIKDHKMHFESFFISDEAAKIINETKARGGKIIAVGTTSLRALESAVNHSTSAQAGFVTLARGLCNVETKHKHADGVTNSARAIVNSSSLTITSGHYTTNIFIHPPYKFKIVDILMTNFHLPKSTLFMLVSTFVGYENAKKIYTHAIKNNYRFYSYGDSSLLFKNDSSL